MRSARGTRRVSPANKTTQDLICSLCTGVWEMKSCREGPETEDCVTSANICTSSVQPGQGSSQGAQPWSSGVMVSVRPGRRLIHPPSTSSPLSQLRASLRWQSVSLSCPDSTHISDPQAPEAQDTALVKGEGRRKVFPSSFIPLEDIKEREEPSRLWAGQEKLGLLVPKYC